jgi:hypothetical protein
MAGAGETIVECFMGGTGHEFLREGWSDIAEDTWTSGRRAVVELPPAEPEIDYSLTVEIAGVAGPPESDIQRFAAVINDVAIANVICRGAQHYEFFVSRQLLQADHNVLLAFDLPNACRPFDFGHNDDKRFLALRVVRIAFAPFATPNIVPLSEGQDGLAVQREALLNVQSLGVNCEIGFIQRLVGAEPLGLFRWTFAPLDKLLPALEKGFEGLGAPGSLEIHVDPRSEFIVRDTVYGFQYHSFVFGDKGGTAEEVLRNEYNRLTYLSRTLVEELSGQEKLFAYHDAGHSGLDDMRRVLQAINRYGNNSLLWVVRAPNESMIGTAQEIEPGLIQAYVSGFQVPVGHILPTSQHQPSWLRAVMEAYNIWRPRA